MDVRIDSTGRHDQSFAGDRLGRHPHRHSRRDARHHIRIAGLSDRGDAAILDPDVRLDDPGPVHDEGVGDDAIERNICSDACGLTSVFRAICSSSVPISCGVDSPNGVLASR